MNVTSNSRGLFIGYGKEYVEFAEVVLYVIDLYVLTVRCRRYINEIYLNALEETCGYDRFKRAFGLAVGLAMIDLIQLDKKKNLIPGYPVVLMVNFDCGCVLSSMA